MSSSTRSDAVDLWFDSRARRERAYDARNSVADFATCMQRYAALTTQARATTAWLADLRYGQARDERLDLYLPVDRPEPAPLFLHLHGGYWRALDKAHGAGMAPVFTAAGIAVAVIDYPLLPTVTLAETVSATRRALAWLWHEAPGLGLDRRRIVVGGSSAGAHLAALLAAPGWEAEWNLPNDAVAGVIALSGLYDLRPLCETVIQDWLRLTPEQAWALSPLARLPRRPLPMLLSVGGREPEGFLRQTDVWEQALRGGPVALQRLDRAHCHHFDLLDELADAHSPLTQAALALVRGPGG